MNRSIFLSAIVILAVWLFGCGCIQNNGFKPLTIKDLKFPPVDEIEAEHIVGNVYLLPKPNRQHIAANHIRSMFAYIEAGKKETHSQNILNMFEARQEPSESFEKWFLRHTACVDSSTFDANGNLEWIGGYGFMCGSFRYKYDSFGFLICRLYVGCTFHEMNYHYYLDQKTRILYYCDTGVQFSSDQFVGRLRFDSAGYLVNSEYKNFDFGYSQTIHYRYNNARQISTIERRDSIVPGGEKSKEPGAKTTGAISHYYYTRDYPDSVITNYIVSNKPDVDYQQKTYFDTTGLPSKSIYINFPNHYDSFEVRRYRYHKF